MKQIYETLKRLWGISEHRSFVDIFMYSWVTTQSSLYWRKKKIFLFQYLVLHYLSELL